MSFYSGQKVVCVYDREIPGEPSSYGRWLPQEVLYKDRIYTVDRVFPDLFFPEVIVCTLFETPRGLLAIESGLLGYNVKRFRPLDERKTDISILKGLLEPNPKKVFPVLPKKTRITEDA